MKRKKNVEFYWGVTPEKDREMLRKAQLEEKYDDGFADGKKKYGLRSTYFRTKEMVHRELTLLYACMNLKKFALHHYA